MLATYEQKRIVYDSQRGWSNNNINGCKIGYIHAISRFLDYVERRLISLKWMNWKQTTLERRKKCVQQKHNNQEVQQQKYQRKRNNVHIFIANKKMEMNTHIIIFYLLKRMGIETQNARAPIEKCTRFHFFGERDASRGKLFKSNRVLNSERLRVIVLALRRQWFPNESFY